jgi:hypothetical protein
MAIAALGRRILEEFDHEIIQQGHSAEISKDRARPKRAVLHVILSPKATPESLHRHLERTRPASLFPGWLGAVGR